EVSITRKVREMITAVELEQRYTKTEIIEMYLNTVSFGFNAYGIEAAARTYYGKASNELTVPEAATLVGLLAATTYYNPVRNPENARQRRNTVMGQMARNGYISASDLDAYREEPVGAQYYSAELYASLAPYFAEHVRLELQRLTRDPEHPLSAYDMYGEGLRVYTTIDSRVQQEAQHAVDEQMARLQAVVDYEWSNERTRLLSREFEPYLELTPGEDYEPFSRFWSTNTNLVNEYIRSTDHYRTLISEGREDMEAVEHLRTNETFIDSLRTLRTRLETGLVAMDPRTGQVRAWVGGRDFRDDRYDKVGTAKRQPGSTFKPFTYVTAIDNGYSPYDTFVDSTFVYQDAGADTTWSPTNFGGSSGQELTMTQALARSLNTITARVALELGPQEIVRYAHRMGIRSELDAVPAISLGTSDVTLLELVSAYSTLANGGLYYEPQTIARVEDRYGNVLWEARSAPQEALSERSAYTVVDMMRGVIDYGTGQRIRTQFGLGNYDLAGKTGTTQRSADGWFIMMHPDLVMGSWVGFNDPRITFRTSTWGQGGRNALFVVGDFARRVADIGEEEGEESSLFSRNAQFPLEDYAPMRDEEEEDDSGGLGW
ncbi:MAG: penicillin-binding transpeptidase domain-containing protein, partial [Longimonas sp.]|uniref:penicillin-binding transpeptidase domain-containing protein n=1 Tax=Longimonas sp. TaxID=2039626 RepID=UPI00335071CB